MTRLWGGRFAGSLNPAMAALSRSAQFDIRLGYDDCRVLDAHAGVLASAGILDAAEAEAVRSALELIGKGFESGTIGVLEADEDVHTAVERLLTEAVGDVAAKVRAGLSRNDRVATAFRMWTSDALHRVCDDIAALIAALIDRGLEHAQTPMPGYTHLQRAQLVTLGHVLAAHALALERDAERIRNAGRRCTAVMPLGAAALAGSTLPLDHARALQRLGFDAVAASPIDAVSSRDFALETLAATAMLGVSLSQIAEHLVLWTTSEFGFATLNDAYATGSSLMPQKKNPDVAELTRAKSGRLIGNFTTLSVACKGLPLAYNRDLQEDKEPVFDSIDTALVVLPALTGAIQTMTFHPERMAEAASDPFLLATDLADRLVQAGVPFREAHDAVGSAVADSVKRGIPWTAFTENDWAKAHTHLAEVVAKGGLDVATSLAARLRDASAILTSLHDRNRP